MIDILVEAIETKHLVSFKYKNKNRRAEVYCIGTNANNEILVRCFEVPTEGWKLFKMEEIKDLKLLQQRFYFTRPDYNPNDKSMVEVLFSV